MILKFRSLVGEQYVVIAARSGHYHLSLQV